MLAGEVLADVDTPALRSASNEDRARAIADLLAAASKKAESSVTKDKAEISKMHSKESYQTLIRIKLTEIDVPPEAKALMWRTLVLTRPRPPDAFQIHVKGIDATTRLMDVCSLLLTSVSA